MRAEDQRSTLDAMHTARFDGDAAATWAHDGPARWLYRYNRVRVPYVRRAACSAFGCNPDAQDALKGLRVLDIGCGIGILCEPLAELGASVLGIDPAGAAIEHATSRAQGSGLDLSYRMAMAETLAEEGQQFDVVLAMEVIEHVADYRLFLETCARLIAPQGLVILSTLNRTFTSWFQAILMGEYVLRLLPCGAHAWRRFVRPEEIRAEFEQHGISLRDVSGVTLKLIGQELQISPRIGVNYILTASR